MVPAGVACGVAGAGVGPDAGAVALAGVTSAVGRPASVGVSVSPLGSGRIVPGAGGTVPAISTPLEQAVISRRAAATIATSVTTRLCEPDRFIAQLPQLTCEPEAS
jgi:hypothetical protein